MNQNLPKSGQFVLLYHHVSETFQTANRRVNHFDLLIEVDANSKLWTWSVNENVFETGASRQPLAAQRLPDHRRDFLNFEGPLTGDRGSVRRMAWGRWSDPASGDELAIQVSGDSISGQTVEGKLVLVETNKPDWSIKFTPADRIRPAGSRAVDSMGTQRVSDE